jgi:hypothetical protein
MKMKGALKQTEREKVRETQFWKWEIRSKCENLFQWRMKEVGN